MRPGRHGQAAGRAAADRFGGSRSAGHPAGRAPADGNPADGRPAGDRPADRQAAAGHPAGAFPADGHADVPPGPTTGTTPDFTATLRRLFDEQDAGYQPDRNRIITRMLRSAGTAGPAGIDGITELVGTDPTAADPPAPAWTAADWADVPLAHTPPVRSEPAEATGSAGSAGASPALDPPFGGGHGGAHRAGRTRRRRIRSLPFRGGPSARRDSPHSRGRPACRFRPGAEGGRRRRGGGNLAVAASAAVVAGVVILGTFLAARGGSAGPSPATLDQPNITASAPGGPGGGPSTPLPTEATPQAGYPSTLPETEATLDGAGPGDPDGPMIMMEDGGEAGAEADQPGGVTAPDGTRTERGRGSGSRSDQRGGQGDDRDDDGDRGRGWGRTNGSGGQPSNVLISASRLDSQARVHLPFPDSLDWVLFGGHSTVQVRAGGRSLIDVSRLGHGRSVDGFTNRFFWSNGTPLPEGRDDIDRAQFHGRARLDVPLGALPRRLDLYVGSDSGQIEVEVGTGRNATNARVQLFASHPGRTPDGIISVQLPAGSGSLQVTLSPAGRGAFTLAAAVLR